MSDDADEFFRRMGIPRYADDQAQPPPDSVSGGQVAAGAGGRVGSGASGSMFEGWDELHREAEDLQRRFSVPVTEGRGRDGTGAVRVTVNGPGRVADVEIDPSWRSSVGERGLSAAVLHAVTDATMRRLAAWAEEVAEQRPSATADRVSGMQPSSPVGVPRPSAISDSAEARRGVEEALSLLEGVEAELDALERRVGERAQQQVVGRSPSHLVKVTVSGGQVVDVDIQRRLTQRTDEHGIARELIAAFDAAYERAASLKLDDLLGDGKLAKLHAFASDPDALLRRLGLGRR